MVCSQVTRVSAVVSDSNRSINDNQIDRAYFLTAPDMFSRPHLNLKAGSRSLEAWKQMIHVIKSRVALVCRGGLRRLVRAASKPT